MVNEWNVKIRIDRLFVVISKKKEFLDDLSDLPSFFNLFDSVWCIITENSHKKRYILNNNNS